jgi:hypothetical protein
MDAHTNTTRKHDFETLYKDRISLQRYFTNNGFNGKEMINILATSHAFVIGPRALEFFVPQTIGSESGWNFYIDNSEIKVYKFMRSMEKIGVVWDDLITRIQQRIINHQEEVCGTQHDFEIAFNELSKTIDENTEDGIGLHHMIEEYQYIQSEVLSSDRIIFWHGDDGSIISSPVNEENQHRGHDCRNEVHGSIMIDGNKIPITLCLNRAYGKGFDVVKFLHKYRLSIMQCMLTGFGAIHLYGKEACKKISYKWEPPMSPWEVNQNIRSREEIASYLDKGFTIMYHPWSKKEPELTRDSKNDSIKILSTCHFGWNEDYWKEMQYQYLDIRWTESCINTIHIPNPDSGNLPHELSNMMDNFYVTMGHELNMTYLRSYGIM